MSLDTSMSSSGAAARPAAPSRSRWHGVGVRMAIGFGLTGLLILALAAASGFSLDRQGRHFTGVLDERLPRIELLQAVHQAIVDLQIASMDALLHDDPAKTETTLKTIQAGRAEIGARIESLQALFKDDGDQGTQAAEAFATHGSGVLVGLVKLGRLVQAGNREQAVSFVDAGLRPKLEGLAKLVADYRAAQMTILAQERAEGEIANRRALWVIAGSAALALTIAGLSGWLITRSVVRPLADARRIGEAIAAGDLTLRVQARGRDESAALLHTMNRMSDDLADIVRRVRQGCESIAAGTQQLAAGNADLSRRTEMQASGLQETTSATAKLDLTVTDNAAMARDASRLADEAQRVAGDGGEAVARLAGTMRGIADESKHIVGIVGIIDSIAFQTNILALNAAVEAARAGEQGRGFAVVASEVRSLAQRSAEAAREIKTMIAASVERIEGGARAADEAGRTVSAALGSVARVNELMQRIAQASEQQAGDVSMVSGAVSRIDEATQQNAALVEQVASASDLMRDQAERVVETVALFRIDSR